MPQQQNFFSTGSVLSLEKIKINVLVNTDNSRVFRIVFNEDTGNSVELTTEELNEFISLLMQSKNSYQSWRQGGNQK